MQSTRKTGKQFVLFGGVNMNVDPFGEKGAAQFGDFLEHGAQRLAGRRHQFRHQQTGQDAVLFDFATDVDNTQRAEINIMQNLLLKEKK